MNCPICETQMLKGEISHNCPKCDFSFPFVYRGRRICEKEKEEFQANKKTSWRDGWTKKDTKGSLCGRLVLLGNKLSFEAKTLKAKCPECQSTVYKDKKRWRCSECDFNIGELLFGRKMSEEEIEKLLFFGHSDTFDNFVSSGGKYFSGSLSLNEDFDLKMNFS